MPHFWIVVRGGDLDAAGRSGAWDGDEPAIGDVIDFEGAPVEIDEKKEFGPPPRQDARNPYKKKLFGHDVP
jgi:hypothetical protein